MSEVLRVNTQVAPIVRSYEDESSQVSLKDQSYRLKDQMNLTLAENEVFDVNLKLYGGSDYIADQSFKTISQGFKMLRRSRVQKRFEDLMADCKFENGSLKKTDDEVVMIESTVRLSPDIRDMIVDKNDLDRVKLLDQDLLGLNMRLTAGENGIHLAANDLEINFEYGDKTPVEVVYKLDDFKFMINCDGRGVVTVGSKLKIDKHSSVNLTFDSNYEVDLGGGYLDGDKVQGVMDPGSSLSLDGAKVVVANYTFRI